MSDGYQPNSNPTPPPPGPGVPSTDQVIGDATSVLSTFMKSPVNAVRMAWDSKKSGVALIVAVVIVAVQLLYSILSLWGVKFGYILGSWIKSSILQILLLALLALIGTILVRGHCNSGYIGALSGVGAAALLPIAGLVVRTVFLLVAKILPVGLFQQLSGLVSAVVGTPLYIAMFVLLALTVRNKTGKTDDMATVKTTIILAVVYYAASYVITQLIW